MQPDQHHLTETLQSELSYYEQLYSGFAQRHFAGAAVAQFRRHLVRRFLTLGRARPDWRVLSLGCGIGDTELVLARKVREVVGIDPSAKGIEQARRDAAARGIRNARFGPAAWQDFREGGFDAVMAVFLLHHLPDPELDELARRLRVWLKPGGFFYALDPSARRLSGAVGRLLIPGLMARYQTPGERELKPRETLRRFRSAGHRAATSWYDFVSTPLAGLAPGWRAGYLAARLLDEVLIRVPWWNRLSSNFEITAEVKPE